MLVLFVHVNIPVDLGMVFDPQRKKQLFSLRILLCNCEVRGHCMCKEMPAIPVDRVVDKKRIIGKNVGPMRRRGTRGC
jgi:hypothetical protein